MRDPLDSMPVWLGYAIGVPLLVVALLVVWTLSR